MQVIVICQNCSYTEPTEPIETNRKFCVTCGHRLVTIGEFDRIANYYTNTEAN
jgi:rRNA maturation endonuclease Nob1